LHVSIASQQPDEFASLYVWLRSDRDLARRARVAVEASQDPAAMGALEVMDVVLTHIAGLTTLAIAVTAWRQSRRRPGPVTITRPDGQTLTIDGPPEVTSDLIIRFLSERGEPAQTPQPPT
jgi:hypothetical protein